VFDSSWNGYALPQGYTADELLRGRAERPRTAALSGFDRLLAAQKGLLPIEELRERMPELRRREQASNAKLQAIADQSVTRAAYLRFAEMLSTFLTRLRSTAGVLDPRVGLADVLAQPPDHRAKRIHEFLPWIWKNHNAAAAAA
jgi:hypothetical protein